MLHALVVSVLMFFGQVHLCQPEYILPTGDTCFTCPTLADLDPQGADAALTESHGDCHDCCTLTACEEPDQAKVKAQSSNDFPTAIADLPERITIRIPLVHEQKLAVPFQENCPPTGPPSLTSSRGPPTPRFGSR